MTHDDLVRSLEVERFNGAWWKPGPVAAPPSPHDDNELTCARRRRELAEACAGYEERQEVG